MANGTLTTMKQAEAWKMLVHWGSLVVTVTLVTQDFLLDEEKHAVALIASVNNLPIYMSVAIIGHPASK